jgi:hypothetical protein
MNTVKRGEDGSGMLLALFVLVLLTGMGAAARDEVLMLFPELATNPESTQKTAHPVFKAYEARVLQAYLA